MSLLRRFGWVAQTIIVLVVSGRSAEKNHSTTFLLINTSPTGWDIEYTPAPRSLTTQLINGKAYLKFIDPAGAASVNEESPALPADAVSLGIPFGSTLTAELINPQYEILDHQELAPHPSYTITSDREAVEVFGVARTPYAPDQFLPISDIDVDSPFTLRQQRVSVVRIVPYQYNPSTRMLRRVIKATIRIQVHRPEKAMMASMNMAHPPDDPFFEESYKSILLNYSQAKSWRVRDVPAVSVDRTGNWFQSDRYYYKSLVATDGWYRIKRSDLIAAGANLSSIDLTSIKVIAKGVELPIVLRPDTTVEFYGRGNLGDTTYSDFYTDTSAYWLTWGGTQGLRFSDAVVSGPPGAIITSSLRTVHLEQNLSYFLGATTEEQINNLTVPGEDWYWRSFNVNTQIDFPFTLDSIDTSNPTAVVRARLWGTGFVDPPTPAQHKARFWINDSLAGEVDFAQRTGATFIASFPSSWLRVGNNVVRVKNIDTGTSGNSFYLDWFEVDYQRKLRAVNDQLSFRSPSLSGAFPVQFNVRGFSNSQIEVYDLSLARRITGVTVSGDSLTGFNAAFQDSFSSQRNYIAFSANGQASVPPLKQKMFKNIRVKPSGADYIFVTHANFLAQANQLAAHRLSVNGVRTSVVDVDDIYDEFNFGIMNGNAIKAFLYYAYQNWAAPAPAYVLMVGDACWDYHRYMSSTIKTNFVPAYGIPAGDNWFGCFDFSRPFIPSLYIGRIPAENVTQAQSAVNKIIGYDSYPVSDWNKSFLFVTGGNTPTEQAGFNYLAENAIVSYVDPPPLGGAPLRVYKKTAGWIDGEFKQTLQNYFRNGIAFMSFTGHSGGRIWGVDPGPPSQLENTNGKLPFISSVSCNVGGFATPQNSVLSEDFVLADNRGAIAMWASSSLGFATYGAALDNYWLSNATKDSVREFGKLTTNARYRLWFETGSGYITIAMVSLNPLIGDPMSKLAVPLKPDLAISSSDIIVGTTTATPNDSSVSLRVNIHNFGLMPVDSVDVTVTDIYAGQTTYLINNRRLSPTKSLDSTFITWKATNKTGAHTLVANVDPLNVISEVNELNNIASSDQYFYANNVFVVKPINNMVVPPGVQRLVVSSPIGFDSSGFQYFFELDTVDTFDSPWRITSGGISPGTVSGEWLTPTLPVGGTYFWRARTMRGLLAGNWVTAAFSTSNSLPASVNVTSSLVRWRESTKKQFSRDRLLKTASTDSGVTIASSPPLYLYARSVGNRPNQVLDYYSTLIVNDQKITGFWWELGNSFMVLRLNEFTGTFEFRNFDVQASTALADSMINFLNTTPAGNYIAISVIFNGQTNVTEGLKRSMDTLGATLFRSIINGQSYAFIGRKGVGVPGMTPIEKLTNDSAVVSVTIPNYYSLGKGTVTSSLVPIAKSWASFHWSSSGDNQRTSIKSVLIGERTLGGVDSLRFIPRDSLDISLSFLNAQTSGPRYADLRVAALLATADANVTPKLADWWLDFSPPADFAVSARTLGVEQNGAAATFSLPVTVYNLGYTKSDTARVIVNALDKYNNTRLVGTALLDSIEIDGSRSTSITFSTSGFQRKTKLQVIVGSARKGRDLVQENNTAYYILNLNTVEAQTDMGIYADGVEIMDGDFVSPNPIFTVRPLRQATEVVAAHRMNMFIDDKPLNISSPLSKAGTTNSTQEHTFTPSLSNGHHELKFRLARSSDVGEIDSVERVIGVNVLNESRILQLANFPNPFRYETAFTFVLAGSKPAESLAIRIFTISGRKIRDLDVSGASLKIGFNRVYWDGRDNDGDEIANGYYFYKVVLDVDGKAASSIEKLVKMK